MKVLEVTTTTRVRDPHRPLSHSLTQVDLYKAADGYELSLHESGLAAYVRGKDHTILAPITRAVVELDEYDPAFSPVSVTEAQAKAKTRKR